MPKADATTVDPDFAVRWYGRWIEARACYLNASYDRPGLMKQIGLYQGAIRAST